MYPSRSSTRRQDFVRVTIKEVNLNRPQAPMAQGFGLHDRMYEIDLRLSVGGAFVVPAVGESWWIERRTNRWALAYKEHKDRVKQNAIGDKIEEISGDWLLKAKTIKVAKPTGTTQEQSFETGFTGTVTVVTGVNFGAQTTTTQSLRFKNGVLVSVS